MKRPDELRSEYRFDYAKAKPNRFAERIRKGSVAVLLDRMSHESLQTRNRSTRYCGLL